MSTSRPFESEEIDGYQVYKVNRTGSRQAPPVLVLHELPALSARTLDFASRLSAQGFAVYVPRLFGNTAGCTSSLATVGTTLEVAGSPKWNLLWAENKTSPELEHIDRLGRTISARHHRPIGVIGMCLTGAFPLALVHADYVAAAAVCQPTTPVFAFSDRAKHSLGLSPADLDASVKAVKNRHLEIFFTRFLKDTISPIERRETLAHLYRGHFRDRTVGEGASARFDIPKHSHATLTNCASSPYGRWVFAEMTQYLHENLH